MVSDLNILAQKWSKIAAAKQVFNDFFLSVLLTFEVPFKRFLPPLPEIGRPQLLDIRNPWGKVMERVGLRFENFFSKVV